ncbi:putative centrin-binding protein Sfi1 [Talaromyces proteolyticus]|uniref:Centrin-binding protein Sfi1 n=1 Tax=Talaromyces proteolyticus TaxID=1131652 RepID=A0AAD4KR36_9EURO|nr:putative centrin-binding protein Sfi1 [Talaromyces proteolyticus]KAH8698570.1 putative centrin-binding protein Sfi1 [Talaromyces proteolyticus]
MPPIPAQRPTLLDENRSLSDQDVGLLFQIITRAEQNPDVEHLPFRALFAAYDEVLAEHGPDADPEQACMRFLFKMGSKSFGAQPLFDRFEDHLQRMGIVLSFDDTEPDRDRIHAQNASFPGPANVEEHIEGFAEDITQRSIRRRASFNSMYDIGDDGTQRHTYRPSSRSSMSRLELGKSDFSEIDEDAVQQDAHGDSAKPSDRTQLLAQFLEMGRRLMGGLDPLRETSQVTKTHTQQKQTNGHLTSSSSSSHVRNGSGISSSNGNFSLDIDEDLNANDMNMVDEIGPKPSLSDLLRDASTFAMYRKRATARRVLIQWLEKAVRVQQSHRDMEIAALNRDRGTLLRQALDLWRAELQKKRETAHTERFFRHLERRAAKARDLYLMTKAFTHWAQLTADEISKTSVAREHILRLKYFNAWREITAVNELKAQRFAHRKPLQFWKKKVQQIKENEHTAETTHATNIKLKYLRILRWTVYYQQRAPEWSDHRLTRRSLLSWIRAFRTQREREAEIDYANRHELLQSVFQAWSQKSQAVLTAECEADARYNNKLLVNDIEVWHAHTRLQAAATHVASRVDTRFMKSALAQWRSRGKSVQQADDFNRLRIMRSAWTNWNDRLRCYALNARIEERLKMETLYKWVLIERCRLAERIRNQRIQRENFSEFIITARNMSRELIQREDDYVKKRNCNALRYRFQSWKNKLAVQRQREYVAAEFYAPRVEQEAFVIWSSKYKDIQKLEKWAHGARFYFSATKTLKQWQSATAEASKKRRQEAYMIIRRKVKMNLASSVMTTWYHKSQHVINLDREADQVNQEALHSQKSELIQRWRERTARITQDAQDAEVYSHRQLAYNMLNRWIDVHERVQGLSEQADGLNLVHVSGLASAQLRKLSLRIFQIQSTIETADSMHDRILRKHHRSMLRHWNNRTKAQREARETRETGESTVSTIPEITYLEPTTPAATFISTILPESEHTLNFTDLMSLPEHQLASTTPIATPGYLASPSRRAARARMLAQMSTTPATPLYTPFASRLRAAMGGDQESTASKLEGRHNSVGTTVRFAIQEPESPSEGRRSTRREG